MCDSTVINLRALGSFFGRELLTDGIGKATDKPGCWHVKMNPHLSVISLFQEKYFSRDSRFCKAC